VRFAFVFREMRVMSRSSLVVGFSLRRMRWQGPITLVSAPGTPLPTTASDGMAKLLERFGGANQQSILLQGLSWGEVPELPE
jgi:hypothetical protein